MAPLGHEEYPNFQDTPIPLQNQLVSLRKFKLELLGYQPITPSCLYQMAPLGHGEYPNF